MYLDADPKPMAKVLRRALRARGTEIPHSEALEIVARQLGFDDWNTLSARLGMTPPSLVLPEGFALTGKGEGTYAVGVDPADPNSPAIIQSLFGPDHAEAGDRFATLMQSVRAKTFHGQRMRFSAELRATNVSGGAAIWMRVDRSPGAVIYFDNLSERASEERPLQGTTGWVPRSIVMEVPADAESFHFGAMLTGAGRAEARGMKLEPVSQDVPVTSRVGRLWNDSPQNLDLSRRRQS